MKNKRQIAIKIAKFYLRVGRGTGLTNFIKEIFKNVVYLGGFGYLSKEWFGLELPYEILLVIAIAWFIVSYVIGYLDEKFGFWKIENHYATETLNPYFTEIKEKLESIDRKLKA